MSSCKRGGMTLVDLAPRDPCPARRARVSLPDRYAVLSSSKVVTSASRNLRWPPGVRIDPMSPAVAHLVTVLGSTPNMRATSAGVSNRSVRSMMMCSLSQGTRSVPGPVRRRSWRAGAHPLRSRQTPMVSGCEPVAVNREGGVWAARDRSRWCRGPDGGGGSIPSRLVNQQLRDNTSICGLVNKRVPNNQQLLDSSKL